MNEIEIKFADAIMKIKPFNTNYGPLNDLIPEFNGFSTLNGKDKVLLLDTLCDLGLLNADSEKYPKKYTISTIGKDLVKDKKSVKDFLEDKKKSEQLKTTRQLKDDIIQGMTLDQLKRTLWQVKYWWVFLLINFAITIITIYISTLII